MMAICLALNFLECFVVSLMHLTRKLSRAQTVLYLKERMLLMILRSHQYGTKIDIEALNFKNLCNKITIMIFINMLRIVIHIEVRRTVRRNWQFSTKIIYYLLYIDMYQQRKKFVHSWRKSMWTTIFCILEWDHCHWQWHFHEEHNDAYCDLPSNFLLDGLAFKSYSRTSLIQSPLI